MENCFSIPILLPNFNVDFGGSAPYQDENGNVIPKEVLNVCMLDDMFSLGIVLFDSITDDIPYDYFDPYPDGTNMAVSELSLFDFMKQF